MTEADGRAEAAVFRRRVFYIPGYDPFHPRRYRELYRSEGTQQARISGYALDMTPRAAGGPFGWRVRSRIGGAETLTEVEVLVWSDLVKASMTRGIAGTYLQLARTAWTYLGSGALWRLVRLRKGPMIAALYPVVLLLVQLGAALLAGWALGRLVAGMHPALGLAAGAALALGMLELFRRWDRHLFAYYLMHDYAYSAQAGGANPPELEERLEAFRHALAEALRGPHDEVLLVGHSSGVHLGISVLADLIRGGIAPGGPALGFLSLGQVVPMVSFLPGAGRLRRDLAYLCTRAEVTWIDVTAPGDGCAFALCDPVAVSSMAPAGGKVWPLVVSAAFTKTLSAERWRALRWRFFRLHFQYLCAFDRPGDYDYFQITAGPMTLTQRYAGRAPSKSVILTPVNRYTGTA